MYTFRASHASECSFAQLRILLHTQGSSALYECLRVEVFEHPQGDVIRGGLQEGAVSD
jgi:hypothetical protein